MNEKKIENIEVSLTKIKFLLFVIICMGIVILFNQARIIQTLEYDPNSPTQKVEGYSIDSMDSLKDPVE